MPMTVNNISLWIKNDYFSNRRMFEFFVINIFGLQK